MTENVANDTNVANNVAQANSRDLTWEELKEFSRKYGAKINSDTSDCECICFGLLEFDKQGVISWYGEVICPVRTYEQMKTIIENMFC